MMALDGKTIIKEEITEKDPYDSSPASTTNSSRRGKASSNKDTLNSSTNSNGSSTGSTTNNPNNSNSNCRTPDSPESARAIAPRSPMSPQVHHSSLAPPPRPNRNASASPVVNGANTTPTSPTPQQQAPVSAVVAVAAAAHVEQARLLSKIRKFLGSLVQLAQEVHPDVSERVRALVLSLGSGGINIDDFRIALQEAISLPLRSYVIPFLKNHISMLQREIAALARATNQTPLQYVTNNENAVMEFATHGLTTEYSDIFVQLDVTQPNSLAFKRRASDTVMEHHNGMQDWNEYMAAVYPPPPAAKRLHAHNGPIDVRLAFGGNQSTLFDYSTRGENPQTETGFNSILDKTNHREERDLRINSAASETQRPVNRTVMNAGNNIASGANNSAAGGEEEWKSIHTMLNCISAMVEKTKRAITILQQRGVEPQQQNFSEVSPANFVEIRRQTEEKVAEFKRNAEEAVNQVKRQAIIEIQRAVVAAETRAAEVMAQERLRMEKFFVEMSRHSGNERELDNKSPSITTAGQNSCWNCGRKATETCSGCNLARYCGAFCQHKDWEHHHQICGTTRSTDLSTKHGVSQVIPLTAALRAGLARSPPTSVQPPQAHSNSTPSTQTSTVVIAGSTAQPTALVTNGIGAK